MKPSIGMPMDRQMSLHGVSDRLMDMNNQMSNMRDLYRNNQDMTSNMMGQEMNRNMMVQEMTPNMRQTQSFGPNQYFAKDDFGNYAYSYNDEQSEKSEEGNDQVKKGRYSYIMSNGVKRRVEYIADNNGFHIIRDNADPARIKRSSEPDLIQTQMTSVMDSSMRNDASDMQRMPHIMGHDMSSQMDRNLMGMDQQRYSNIMMNRNMVGQDSMVRNMMGRNVYNSMSNRGMTSDMSSMMGQEMDSKMMGRDMTMNMMGPNMMGQDRTSQMMRRNMMSHRDITPNMMYGNIVGQDLMANTNQISSNMINSNNGLMGQHTMQRMVIEHFPETYTSTRFF